jgi:hypothetical protein
MKRWCEVHKKYFELDESGWPNCEENNDRDPIV